jgi:hypothetical protein
MGSSFRGAQELNLERKVALRPEKENAAFWTVIWPEEVPHMAVFAKLN